jgi:hypothetical protein
MTIARTAQTPAGDRVLLALAGFGADRHRRLLAI